MPDHAVVDRPGARSGMTVDAGAVRAKYRVDSSKPIDSKAIPGVLVDVIIDAEEDRGGVTTSSGIVQPQSGLSVFHAAVVPASEIRRVRPTRLAVLVVADGVQARCAQCVSVLACNGLEIEVSAGTRFG